MHTKPSNNGAPRRGRRMVSSPSTSPSWLIARNHISFPHHPRTLRHDSLPLPHSSRTLSSPILIANTSLVALLIANTSLIATSPTLLSLLLLISNTSLNATPHRQHFSRCHSSSSFPHRRSTSPCSLIAGQPHP